MLYRYQQALPEGCKDDCGWREQVAKLQSDLDNLKTTRSELTKDQEKELTKKLAKLERDLQVRAAALYPKP